MQTKAAIVMREFYRGTLRSGRSGLPVTDVQQAKAIAMSEARKAAMKKAAKKAHHKKTTHRSAKAVHHAGHPPSRPVHKAKVHAHPAKRPASFSAPKSGSEHLYAKGAPSSEWDRLWHGYLEANRHGSLNDQIKAGKALLRFDRIHGTPPMQHVAEMLAEARKLVAGHQKAYQEAKQLKAELARAERTVAHHAGIGATSKPTRKPRVHHLSTARRPKRHHSVARLF